VGWAIGNFSARRKSTARVCHQYHTYSPHSRLFQVSFSPFPLLASRHVNFTPYTFASPRSALHPSTRFVCFTRFLLYALSLVCSYIPISTFFQSVHVYPEFVCYKTSVHWTSDVTPLSPCHTNRHVVLNTYELASIYCADVGGNELSIYIGCASNNFNSN
jgi:hypothetical protein